MLTHCIADVFKWVLRYKHLNLRDVAKFCFTTEETSSRLYLGLLEVVHKRLSTSLLYLPNTKNIKNLSNMTITECKHHY